MFFLSGFLLFFSPEFTFDFNGFPLKKLKITQLARERKISGELKDSRMFISRNYRSGSCPLEKASQFVLEALIRERHL